jgi:uncharacterized protein
MDNQQAGETNLAQLLRTMRPALNEGAYVFCTLEDVSHIAQHEMVMCFKEAEGCTLILEKSIADQYTLPYSYVAAWITLTVHSSLEAVGLTAAFAQALAQEKISCNVVAGFYHDHIFVDQRDADKALRALEQLSEKAP